MDGLEAALKTAGVEFEVHRYDTVGHAFMNETPEGIARRYVSTVIV